MTDKPTPTDAELKAMWQIHAADIGGIFHYARAVLAKWGQPAQAAEPVAYMEVSQSESEVSMTWTWGPEPAGFSIPNGRYPLYTTPQPTQAPPAAREPLTNEHIRAMLNTHPPEDVCDWSYRMGIDDAELHHGIKGG